MGYTCVAAPLDFQAFALFAVVFLWQFPHFMAIAWMYRDDYAAGRMQMLTVVDPSGRRAGRLAVVTAAALVPVGVLPVLGTPEPLFIASALALGLAQWACSVVFWIRTDRRHARWLLRASLVYLPGLLALLVVIPLLR
jgi:protoheme IX farnesyltransferase